MKFAKLRVLAAISLFLVLPLGTAVAQEASVSGVVTDASTDEPIPGANVVIEELQLGEATGPSGRYQITSIPAGAYTLTVSFVGYHRFEESIELSAGEEVVVNIPLQPEEMELEEVVVTGAAGEARTRELGSTVARLDAAEIDRPSFNVDDMLQGEDPSITVNPGSATPGAGAQIRMRGNTSMTLGNQPLVYIDGVRQASIAYPQNNSQAQPFYSGSNTQASPINDVNPSDIDRIEVVRGAAASTLYGSEAAAGVIQIFTKDGHTGDPLISYEMGQNLSWLRPFGSEQRPYVGMDHWLRTAHGHTHNLSISGGSPDVNYFVSGRFEDSEGVMPDDHENRGSVRANISYEPISSLRMNFRSNYMVHDFEMSPAGNNTESILFNVYRAPNNFVGSSDPEDIDELREVHTGQTNERLNLGLTTRWNPIESLSSRLVVGYDQLNSNMEQKRPFGYVLKPEGDIVDINWQSRRLTFDYISNLDFAVTRDLASEFSVGGQFSTNSERTIDGYGEGLPGPGEHTLNSTAERAVHGQELKVNQGGAFVQNKLEYRDRLFLTAGLRVDGHSAFGQDFGLEFYPKADLSYVISDEQFWNEDWGALRLRAAYGHAGRAPGAFDAVRTWEPVSFAGNTAFEPGNVGNPNLGPERTAEFEIGFEGTTLEERLSVDFNYYHQRTSDALFGVQQPPSLGFLSSQLENVGELTNQGVEINVNGTVLQLEQLTWELGGGLYTNHSEIQDTGGETFYTIVEGQPGPVVRGTKVLNRDAMEDPELEEDAFFGPNRPTHTIGLNTTVGLPAGIRLTLRGEYQGGHYMSDFPSSLLAQRGPGAVGCDHVYEVVPHEEYSGPGDSHPNLDQVRALDRIRCYSQAPGTEVWTMPADFFKLRALTLRVPATPVVPYVDRAVATFALRNFYTWTNSEFYSYDPEMVSARSNVDALTQGITDQLPPPASFRFSFRVEF